MATRTRRPGLKPPVPADAISDVRVVKTSSTRPRARVLQALVAFGLAVMMSVCAGSAASAEQEDPNWWYNGMHVDEARAEGLTGAGVKIAVVDTAINPNLGPFQGANLTVSPGTSCAAGGDPVSEVPSDGARHGTGMVALLVARPVGEYPMRGIAPDADVTFYSAGPDECVDGPDGRTSIMDAVLRAVRDGNRIVSVSMGQSEAPEADAAVVAEALAKGVVIVTSSPNHNVETNLVSPYTYNGVVSTAAVGRDGAQQTDPDGVTPVIVPSVTVVAPGIGILGLGNADGWEGYSLSTGSSNAAPLVAGSLALLAQKYPAATGNQLIQALISSTAQARLGKPRDETGGYGYGAVSLRNLLATDPTTLPDENPLMDNPLGVPTAADVAAAGGTPTSSQEPSASPGAGQTDTGSTPGTDAPPAAGSTGAMSAALPWLIGGGVGVLAVVIVVVIVVATRTRRTPAP